MYHVILCSLSETHPEVAYITVDGGRASKAAVHDLAAKEFRKKFNLAPNIYVQTAGLYEAETKEMVEQFVKELSEAIEEQQRQKND